MASRADLAPANSLTMMASSLVDITSVMVWPWRLSSTRDNKKVDGEAVDRKRIRDRTNTSSGSFAFYMKSQI